MVSARAGVIGKRLGDDMVIWLLSLNSTAQVSKTTDLPIGPDGRRTARSHNSRWASAGGSFEAR